MASSGRGDFPILSRTPKKSNSLWRQQFYGNEDSQLQTWLQDWIFGAITHQGDSSVVAVATTTATGAVVSGTSKTLVWAGGKTGEQETRVYQYETQIPYVEVALWSPSVELVAFDVNYRDVAPFVAGLETALRAIRGSTSTHVLWSYTTQEGGALRVVQRATVLDVVSLSAPASGSRAATTISGLSRGDLGALWRGLARTL